MTFDRRLVSPETIELLSQQGLVCLRNKKTKQLMNTSYTEEGLKHSTDKLGLSIYYNPRFTKKFYETEPHVISGKRVDKITKVGYYGSFTRNDLYEVVPYIPMNHVSDSGYIIKSLQSAEIFGVSKSFALIKNMNQRTEYLEELGKNTKTILDDSIVDDAILSVSN